MGLLGGWLAESTAPPLPTVSGAHTGPGLGLRGSPGLRAGVSHAIEVLRSIWGWLLIGILVSAAIGTWVPVSTFASLRSAAPWVGFGFALLISLPLYVCATASVPIAAALVHAGLPTGAALVFLVAGPATNVATLGAVHRALGRRVLAVYLSTIVLGSLLGAYVFDRVAPWSAVRTAHHEHATGWFGWFAEACAIALVVLIAWFASTDLQQRWRARQSARIDSPTRQRVGVDGLTCQGCVRKLERVLRADTEVSDVSISLGDKEAQVAGRISPERLADLIREAGFHPR